MPLALHTTYRNSNQNPAGFINAQVKRVGETIPGPRCDRIFFFYHGPPNPGNRRIWRPIIIYLFFYIFIIRKSARRSARIILSRAMMAPPDFLTLIKETRAQ